MNGRRNELLRQSCLSVAVPKSEQTSVVAKTTVSKHCEPSERTGKLWLRLRYLSAAKPNEQTGKPMAKATVP